MAEQVVDRETTEARSDVGGNMVRDEDQSISDATEDPVPENHQSVTIVEQQLPILSSSSSAVSPSDTASRRGKRAQTIEVTFMTLAAIGSTIGWTAVLSNLVFYTMMLGLDSYLYLNLAVYAPLLPITMAQAAWDSHFDEKVGSRTAFGFRGALGYALTIVATALVPFCSQSLGMLSMTTLILGISSGALHGTLKQMASFIYPNCGRLPAAVASGMQASAVLVLMVTLTTGFGGQHPRSSYSVYIFYGIIVALEVVCGLAFFALISYSPDVMMSMLRRDSSFHNPNSSVATPLILPQTSTLTTIDDREEIEGDGLIRTIDGPEADGLIITSPREPVLELSFSILWAKTWGVCTIIMLTVGSSMSVASWFNRVISQDPTNMSLPQILFYTRLFSDLVGRPATLIPCSNYMGTSTTTTTLRPQQRLIRIGVPALLRLLFVPLFFMYVSTNWIPRNDAIVILCVALFSFSSGYLATACYQLAPFMLRPEEQVASTSKQAGLINVCFSAAVLLGLILSFSLRGMDTESPMESMMQDDHE